MNALHRNDVYQQFKRQRDLAFSEEKELRAKQAGFRQILIIFKDQVKQLDKDIAINNRKLVAAKSELDRVAKQIIKIEQSHKFKVEQKQAHKGTLDNDGSTLKKHMVQIEKQISLNGKFNDINTKHGRLIKEMDQTVNNIQDTEVHLQELDAALEKAEQHSAKCSANFEKVQHAHEEEKRMNGSMHSIDLGNDKNSIKKAEGSNSFSYRNPLQMVKGWVFVPKKDKTADDAISDDEASIRAFEQINRDFSFIPAEDRKKIEDQVRQELETYERERQRIIEEERKRIELEVRQKVEAEEKMRQEILAQERQRIEEKLRKDMEEEERKKRRAKMKVDMDLAEAERRRREEEEMTMATDADETASDGSSFGERQDDNARDIEVTSFDDDRNPYSSATVQRASTSDPSLPTEQCFKGNATKTKKVQKQVSIDLAIQRARTSQASNTSTKQFGEDEEDVAFKFAGVKPIFDKPTLSLKPKYAEDLQEVDDIRTRTTVRLQV